MKEQNIFPKWKTQKSNFTGMVMVRLNSKIHQRILWKKKQGETLSDCIGRLIPE